MSAPISWHNLLSDLIRQPSERERIANEIGVNSLTLDRWCSGKSILRSRKIGLLLQALSPSPRELVTNLLTVAAYPIMYTNHMADCLLVSSTQPRYFASPARQALIADLHKGV